MTRATQESREHESAQEPIERLQTDLTSWEMGPYDSRLPSPLKVVVQLDGERIIHSKIEAGYYHRGFEKILESLEWNATIAYADRLDTETGIFGELALCMAAEEIAELAVPPRARDIRLILCELGRIAFHMGYMVRFARTVSSETMIHYVLRDREKILDLFELITGARFTHNFLRFGGVRADVTEGFIERVIEVCELLKFRIKEYNDLLTFNHAFIQRTQGIGWLSASQVRAFGVTGPNARASGVLFDVRRAHPYLNYERQDFKIPKGRHKSQDELGGDAYDRFVVRLREISESIEILKQAAETISEGEFKSGKNCSEEIASAPFIVPLGEAYSRVETPRGMLGCYLVSDGSQYPARVQFRPPSLAHLQVVENLLIGESIEDLPVIFSSLDIGIAEVDR